MHLDQFTQSIEYQLKNVLISKHFMRLTKIILQINNKSLIKCISLNTLSILLYQMKKKIKSYQYDFIKIIKFYKKQQLALMEGNQCPCCNQRYQIKSLQPYLIQKQKFANQRAQKDLQYLYISQLLSKAYLANEKVIQNKQLAKYTIQQCLKKSLQIIYYKKQQFMPIYAQDATMQSKLLNMLGKEIVKMQMSPHASKLQQLTKNQQKFKDDRFPPTLQSLSGQWGLISQWKEFKWKKITEIIKNPEIFIGKIEPNDICQGYLSDCYFLAALAALAEVPQRIYNLFLQKKLNNQKYFSVKMLYKGKWMTIDMDQYVPFDVKTKQLAFSRARKDQLWVVLLEKAWAKLYTSYKRIQLGHPEQVLHDLTGAPIKQIYLQDRSFKEKQQWQNLVEASERLYAMVATSLQSNSSAQISESGVVKSHAYTFLKAFQLQYNGTKNRIVKLRNPFAKMEPHGAWDQNDFRWNLIPNQYKKKAGFEGKADDGVFFMAWQNFCKQFYSITIAQINDFASYTYLSYTDHELKGCYFKIEIYQQGHYCFTIDNTPERSYKGQDGYKYPNIKIIIMSSIDNKTICQVQVSKKRTLYVKRILQKGIYLVYVKIDFLRYLQRHFDVNLAVYGDKICSIVLASSQEAKLFNQNQIGWNGEYQKQKPWNNLGNLAWELNTERQYRLMMKRNFDYQVGSSLLNPEKIQSDQTKCLNGQFNRIKHRKDFFIRKQNQAVQGRSLPDQKDQIQ